MIGNINELIVIYIVCGSMMYIIHKNKNWCPSFRIDGNNPNIDVEKWVQLNKW